jgi:hypothetical protein
MAYGVSNHPVDTLRLPRWTSLAVAGLGFSMLMATFAFSIVALPTTSHGSSVTVAASGGAATETGLQPARVG